MPISTEPTNVVRVRESDVRAVEEMAKRLGWSGSFPELLNRYHEWLRRRAEEADQRTKRRASAATHPRP